MEESRAGRQQRFSGALKATKNKNVTSKCFGFFFFVPPAAIYYDKTSESHSFSGVRATFQEQMEKKGAFDLNILA